MAIIGLQDNLRWPAPAVTNWKILLEQSFSAFIRLLTATSALRLGRRRWSSRQRFSSVFDAFWMSVYDHSR